MDLIYHPLFEQHDTGMHPENKKRLEVLGPLEPAEIEFNEDVLALVHDKEYIEMVREFSAGGIPLDGDTRTSARSFEAAVLAANATVLAAERQDMAVVRPPGHHAYPGKASGFCLFNNVAIATQKLVDEGKKVLIFDFDGHLGDGTSRIFYDSSEVMYWSIHQYPAFPGFGIVDEIGEGNGKGFTVNNPLPPGSGDDIYFNAIEYTLPIALQFDPDVVAVSAGFDAHQYDLLLDLRLSAGAFYETGKILKSHFDNVFATLEGGYNVEELPRCLYNFVDGINGSPQRHSERSTETDIKIWAEHELRLDQLLVNMKKYWNI